MYNINFTSQPYRVNFSKNPIVYGFFITPFSKSDIVVNTKLSVALHIWMPGKAVRIINTYILDPNADGLCSIDLSSVIDSQLDWHLFDPFSTAQFVDMPSQYGKFKITARLYNEYEQLAEHLGDWYNVIKGGNDIYSNDKLADVYLYEQKHFLKYYDDINQRDVNERIYSTILGQLPDVLSYDIDATGATVKVVQDYVFHDTTTATSTTTSVGKIRDGNVWTIRTGIHTYNLRNNVNKWTTKVYLTFSGSDHLIAQETYYARRKEVIDHYLLYHNSLGGIDTLQLYDKSQLNYSYNQIFARRIDTSRYLTKNVIAQHTSIELVTEEKSHALSTYLMTRKSLDLLRDLFLTTSKLLVNSIKAIPVRLDADFSIGEHNDYYAASFDFTHLVDYRTYVSDALALNYATCPVPISLNVKQVSGARIQIFYELPENVYTGQITLLRTEGASSWNQDTILYDNKGSINLSTAIAPSGTSPTDHYTITVKLYTDCNGTLSTAITKTIDVSLYMPPYAPFKFSDTFKGSALRRLTFRDGSDNLLNGLVNYIPEKGWGPLAYLGDSSAPVTTKFGAKGGTFKIDITSLTEVKWVAYIDYTPPSATFTGIDYVPWCVQMFKYATSQYSDLSSSRIYVFVSDGIATGIDSSAMVTVIYIKIVWSDEYIDNSGMPILTTTWRKDIKMFFYSDPSGIYPVDVTGLGITVTINVVDIVTDTISSTINEDVSGVMHSVSGLIVKHLDTGGAGHTYDYEIPSTVDYYVIE